MTNDALKSELRESAIIMANLPIEFGVACLTEAGAQRIAKVLTDAATALEAMEAGGWLPIETCPETGFFLVHKDGAIRTMFRFEGKWDHADPPILIDQWGDSMVSNEVEKHYPGKKLGISGGILEPTHYQPLPTPPKD